MHGADQLYRWNSWLDQAEPSRRFDLAVWGFAALGLLNLLLTFAFGMTFGILLFIGLVVLNLLRLPYALGELPSAEGVPAGAARLEAWHRQVTAMPATVFSLPTLGVALAAIFGIGALGLLTSKFGLPFGVLFLLTMLNALVLVRGRDTEPSTTTAAPMAKAMPAIGQDTMPGTAMAVDAEDRHQPSPA